MREAPPIRGILETAIYADDLPTMHDFYGGVLGLTRVLDTPRMATYTVAQGQVLLIFRRGTTEEDSETPGGIVPGHHSEGPAHFAFAIDAEVYAPWKAYITASAIPIRSEVTWPQGGRSIYFDDPAGNVVELATPGIWPGA